jgi:hypothetical protein
MQQQHVKNSPAHHLGSEKEHVVTKIKNFLATYFADRQQKMVVVHLEAHGQMEQIVLPHNALHSWLEEGNYVATAIKYVASRTVYLGVKQVGVPEPQPKSMTNYVVVIVVVRMTVVVL